MAFVPSPRQSAIAHRMQKPGNILVQACAGSGKTTTMVWLASMIPAYMRVLALSFNKSIAEELGRRMPAHVRSATMHSIGFSMVRRAMGKNVRLDDTKLRNIIETHPGVVIYQNNVKAAIMSDLLAVVPLAQDTMVPPHDVGLLAALAEATGRNLENPDFSLPLVASIVAAMDKMRHTITYAEMIRHPVIHDYPADYYDVVFVDEAQDLNGAQHLLLKKLIRPVTGKLIAVGDRFQSIYGFRGADVQSMDRLRGEWAMDELPLDVCYRCGSSIIEEAQHIVGAETIKAHDDAPTGDVLAATVDKMIHNAEESDMILCRINAPLVPVCLQLLRDGKTARIRGRDIGAMLSGLVRRSRTSSAPDLIAWTMEWKLTRMEKARKAQKPEAAIQAIADQADTLIAIAEECTSTADVLDKLADLFRDDRAGITLSTVHKAKGLEAGRVWLLGPELLPAPWAKSDAEQRQEKNIAYVAVTRAMRSLVRVPLPPRRRDD